MLEILWTVLTYPLALLRAKHQLALEVLALRHQITVLNRQHRRPALRWWDRRLWVMLKKVWPGWSAALMIVQPETVIGWQRTAWRTFWRWKSRRRGGRPGKDPELVDLIRRMWTMKPTWGSPRIRDELRKLGLQASTATIRKYRPKSRRKPSQGWRTFLRNHVGAIAAVDFFVVPTVTFRLVYVLIVMTHERRKVIHFNLTEAPSSGWTAQQIINASPYDTAPNYLLRDRDSIYGTSFVRRVDGMGFEQKLISPHSPWQSPYVERPIGSIRRECLDRMIVANQQHLQRTLESYFQYYHDVRPHRGLEHDSPVPRRVQSPEDGKLIEIPLVGGLHHHYLRQAA